MKRFRPHRRDFIRVVVVGTTAVGLSMPVIGCGDEAPTTSPVDPSLIFRQGVASGDPRTDSVILWTRVHVDEAIDVEVKYEVSTNAEFSELVATGSVTAQASADHTVRLKLTELSPYTTYFFRFESQNAVSMAGRTRTAPLPEQPVDVRFAVASCQDFNGRYYHAWAELADRIEGGEDIDFVLFMGDYIYETTNDPRFQEQGGRSITLPDGLDLDDEGRVKAALTVDDYRTLYRGFRSDENLQRIHALVPFICIWDDHEFADDSWGDHSTHFNELQGDEQNTERRMAASQAWYEYQPADVEHRPEASFPDDLTIYRSFRYGQHVDLYLTDARSYRDDHVINEGPILTGAAKLNENTEMGARYFVLKSAFDDIETESPAGLLGDSQRQWLVDGLTASDATWKIWGSSIQLSQMCLDLQAFDTLPDDYRSLFYYNLDQWDGYRTERRGIFEALSGVENLVTVAGDIHGFYAAELHPDFDAPGEPVAAEFTVAGISSKAIQQLTFDSVSADEVLVALGLLDLVPIADEILTSANPHYRYNNSNANGLGLVEVSAAGVDVEFVMVGDVTVEEDDGQRSTTAFRVDHGSSRITRSDG